MKNMLVLGAGRSSSSLIKYLLDHAQSQQWQVLVGDVSKAAAELRINNHSRGRAVFFDITDEKSDEVLRDADIVISLLPAHLHASVAAKCLKLKKHLLTASYVSPEMKALHQDAVNNNLLFMNECGLDPGIDHMSAMQVIDNIRSKGGKLISFESFTGGLIAPETDPENPWRYKFTWNPRNVVMAGQGTAKYLQGGKFKYISYPQLFKRITNVTVPGYGNYEGYANRDSLKYIETYKLDGIQTMLRGTLRNAGYCEAWNVFVQLGCCDDTFQMEGIEKMTHRDFLLSFVDADGKSSLEDVICKLFSLDKNSQAIKNLQWSGFFSEELIGLDKGTPAQILEHILNKKWKLSLDDKDQIVMWHRFKFLTDGKEKEIQSSLVVTGSDSVYTAMAKTVGLPLAITARLLANGRLTARGVVIPTLQEIYHPILEELKENGVDFSEIES